jgi:RNA polymerase sigma-70 factor (ECF subfamily)
MFSGDFTECEKVRAAREFPELFVWHRDSLGFGGAPQGGREIAENQQLDDRATEENAGESRDAGIWVRQALKHLRKDEREILMLREYEQLSYEEIAGLMRLPVNTVRSRLFRARMALKNQLMPVKD